MGRKSKHDSSIHSCALLATGQQLVAGVPRMSACCSTGRFNKVDCQYSLHTVVYRTLCVCSFFCLGLRPHVSTNIPLLNRSFHFAITFTFLGTLLILVISKTCIWPFVIKNCSRNWQITNSMELNPY